MKFTEKAPEITIERMPKVTERHRKSQKGVEKHWKAPKQQWKLPKMTGGKTRKQPKHKETLRVADIMYLPLSEFISILDLIRLSHRTIVDTIILETFNDLPV